MAPYSPPTAGRAGKLRLDFNENTVGCSPRVIEFLKQRLDAPAVSRSIRNMAKPKPPWPNLPRAPGPIRLHQRHRRSHPGLHQHLRRRWPGSAAAAPAYAMYRFYAQVAGATVREIDYDGPHMDFPLAAMLDAITPATRAVLIANPNNPTGTGLSLPAIERILKRARKAVVFIDEAYFEFSGVTALGQIERSPNLFVSRTFSKVYGMAAMRLGCLFSHPANIAYLHKAQSPYSVNTLAVLAAQAAIRDTAYIENYVAEVLAARELLCVGLEKAEDRLRAQLPRTSC
jgi:histidinol-phosphate aminotransferase